MAFFLEEVGGGRDGIKERKLYWPKKAAAPSNISLLSSSPLFGGSPPLLSSSFFGYMYVQSDSLPLKKKIFSSADFSFLLRFEFSLFFLRRKEKKICFLSFPSFT